MTVTNNYMLHTYCNLRHVKQETHGKWPLLWVCASLFCWKVECSSVMFANRFRTCASTELPVTLSTNIIILNLWIPQQLLYIWSSIK